VVKTFYQPHLIQKHLTGPEVPNWSSWANYSHGLVFALEACAAMKGRRF